MTRLRWTRFVVFFGLVLTLLVAAGAVNAATGVANPSVTIQGATATGPGFVAPFIADPAVPAILSGPVKVCFDTNSTDVGQLYVNVNNNPNLTTETLVAQGPSGCANVDYVASNTLIFKLYGGTTHSSVLKDVEAREAIAAVTGDFGISANGQTGTSVIPIQCNSGTFASPKLKFSTGDGSFGAIYVTRTVSGTGGFTQGPTLLTIGQFGTLTPSFPLSFGTYTFSLYKVGLSTGFAFPGSTGPPVTNVNQVRPSTFPTRLPSNQIPAGSGLIPVASTTVTTGGGGCLAANPNPVPNGANFTTTTITFASGTGGLACVYVSADDSPVPPRKVSCQQGFGAVVVDFITTPGVRYTFYLSDDLGNVLPQGATSLAPPITVTKVITAPATPGQPAFPGGATGAPAFPGGGTGVPAFSFGSAGL